jgi:hypothetical protein
MNPAHLQNGLAMGRGMPPNVPQMQQAQNQNNNMQRHIITSLQGQGPFSGWQATITVEQRAIQVKLLIDSLRLIKPVIELPRAVQVALSFEQKAFVQSSSLDAYVGMCKEKLGQIHDTRQQQQQNSANAQNAPNQNNAMQQMQQAQQVQQMQQMGQNLNFPPQLQHQMQASPLPNQQRLQQQQQFQQQQLQLQQQQQHNSMNTGQAMNQNMSVQQGGMQENTSFMQGQQQKPLPPWKPSKEDNEAINKLAAQMAERTPPADIAKIRANLDNMTTQQREIMNQKGVDPLLYFFRTQAAKEYRRQKMNEMATGSNADSANGNQNNVSQGQGQRQTPVGVQGNRPLSTNGQAATIPFLGNLDHFQGQQADGLRSQEAGHLVVPASTNTQGMNTDQFRMQQQMMQRQQLFGQNPGQSMNPNFLAQQQHIQQAQQAQQDKIQSAAQFQARSQAEARSQTVARVQFAQNQPNLHSMPRTNTPMSMLNRGVDPNISGGPSQGTPRPPSAAPLPGQQVQGQQQQPGAQMQPNSVQGVNTQAGQVPRPGPSGFAALPPQLQQLLLSRPQSEWKQVMQEYQQNPAMRRNMQAPDMQQTISQPGQIPRTQDGQFLGGSTIAPPMQQSLSAGPNSVQGQAQNMTPNPQMILQQRQRQQQQQNQEMVRQRQLQMQMQMQQQGGIPQQQQQQPPPQPQRSGVPQPPQGAFQMNSQQIAFMDKQQFSPSIHQVLSRNPNFPQQIRSWGQLKQWLASNPLPQLPLDKVLALQKKSFHDFLQANAQNRALSGQPGQQSMPPNAPQPIPVPQAQPVNFVMPQGPPGQQSNAVRPNVFGAMPPIPEAAITRARMVNEQLRDMPRNQLIGILTAQRERQARLKQMEQQAIQGQQNQFVPIPPGPMQAQPQPGGPPMGRQPSNQGISQIGMSTHGQQSQPFPGSQRPQSTKPASQPTQHAPLSSGKGIKRMSDDDVVEVSGPVAAPQPRPQSAQIPGKQMPGIAQDIIDKMSPTQRQHYNNLRAQNQQNQGPAINQRINELTREVQGAMPKMVPIALMDTGSRTRILKVLTSDDTKNMLGRFDQLLAHYLLLTRDEDAVKNLISQRMHILHQYKPNSISTKIFEPQDNFSISADYAESARKDMFAKFQQTLERTQKPGVLRQPGVPPSQVQQPLSAENLRQLQAQNEAQRKLKGQRTNDVPPAPTASQPPFSIGDSRGHGTPRYAAQGLKQEDLKLDPNKKRKKNPPGTAASTPATNQGTPAPVASPQQTKAKKPEVNSFKCAVTGCEYQMKGFQTKNELDIHTKDAHRPAAEPPIADPRAFFIEQSRHGLGLDEDGQSVMKVDTQHTQEGSKAPVMQKSFSKASTTNVKQESKPSTPAAMARGASQNDNKAGSPASNMLKTPQLGSDKAAGDKSAGTATAIGKIAKAERPGTSLWDSSPITLSSLQETFTDINMDGVMALDPGMDIDNLMDLYMQSDAWTKTQPDVNAVPLDDSSNESPLQNSEGGRARQASLDSDTSKSGDEAFVKIGDIDIKMVDVDDSWTLPELVGQDKAFDVDEDEWGNITIDELNMSEDEGETWKDIDWDKVLEGQDGNENGEVGVVGIKA